MADLKAPIVAFSDGCPDCGERLAVLPLPLPGVTDDFDWKTRDYDSFRLMMMQELAYRFPERQRWTPADMEVVLVEVLAAALDRLSYALDAVQAERYLATARRPESVRRLLKLIGYDAVRHTDPAILENLPPPPPEVTSESAEQQLERFWRLDPSAMEAARQEGPRLTEEVRRMVTLDDHATLLETHPLVARAQARLVRTGAWPTILIAALLVNKTELDDSLHSGAAPAEDGRPNRLDEALWNEVVNFHRIEGLALPPVNEKLTPRSILRVLIEQNRMVGTEVFLEGAKSAAVRFTLSVRAKKGYFQSELKQALHQVFSTQEGGFFEPGKHGFGDDLYASDLIEAAMKVEGVEVACLNRFQRISNRSNEVAAYPDRTAAGVIEIEEDEYVRCENNHNKPQNGTYQIIVNAGEIA